MPATRDPVSTILDRGARRLLERAYQAPRGQWVMTRLADPSPEEVAWAMRGYGIDILGPDRPTTESGRNNTAYTRWGRAFVRAMYFQHKWYGDTGGMRATRRVQPWGRPLQVEWGRRMPRRGVIPPGRAVRVRLAVGGKTALRVVQAKPDAERIYSDEGAPVARWADPAKRDWA